MRHYFRSVLASSLAFSDAYIEDCGIHTTLTLTACTCHKTHYWQRLTVQNTLVWKCRNQKCVALNANWLVVQRIVARLVAYVASAVKNNQGERFGRRVGFPYLVTTYRAGFCRHCHLCCAGRPHTFLFINTSSSSMSCRKQSHVLAIQMAACVLRYVDGYIALSW
jgi:hypothetical protein